MISRTFLLVVFALTAPFFGGTSRANTIDERPKVGLVIVVDQMRGDYVTRFAPFFTGGLKRILSEGAVFDSASHEHANTETAVGHATLGTGCYPMHHGIVSNEFYDREHDTVVNAVKDTTMHLLRTTYAELKREDSLGSSPHYLMHTGIGNWAKSTGRNRVFSISLKDRAAILMAGQAGAEAAHFDGVYWWDRKTGDFVTSTAYATKLPNWVDQFNSGPTKNIWKDSTWDRVLDSANHRLYSLIGPDRVAQENDGNHTTFPHAFLTERKDRKYFDALYPTPFADQLLIRFVRELIAKERVGQVDGQDLILLSCSAADAIGHAYGPNSHEIFDYYLRLDKYLDTLLRTIDSAVGRSNYVVALSSDHGCVELAVGQNRVKQADYESEVKRLACQMPHKLDACNFKFLGTDVIVPDLQKRPSDSDQIDPESIKDLLAELAGLPFVCFVSFRNNLVGGHHEADDGEPDFPASWSINPGYYEGRSPDFTVLSCPYVYVSSSLTGTGHGSPYWYDRHVPLVFWGPGIAAKHIADRVRTVDMAPTLSELLGITAPDLIDGRSLVNEIIH